MNILLRMLIAAVLLVLTVGTGIWMSSLIRPFQGRIYTFHRIVAIVTTVNMVSFVLGLLETGRVDLPLVLLLLLGGLSVISVFVSGNMLAQGKGSVNQATTIHALMSILAIVTIGLFLFVMIWKNIGDPA